MGANASINVSVTDITKNAITNVLMSSSSNCNIGSANSQELNIGNINTKNCNVNISNISQVMKITTNLTCAQSASSSSELSNQMKDMIKKDIESNTKGGIGFGLSTNTSIEKSVTNIVNNIDIKSIAECVARNLNSQLKNIKDITMECNDDQTLNIDNISQTIISNTVSKCIQSNTNLQNSISDLQSTIDTKLSATTTGFLSELGNLFGPLLIFVVLIMAGGLYYKYNANNKQQKFSITHLPDNNSFSNFIKPKRI